MSKNYYENILNNIYEELLLRKADQESNIVSNDITQIFFSHFDFPTPYQNKIGTIPLFENS